MSRTYRNIKYCGVYRNFKYKRNISVEAKAAEELRGYRKYYTRNRCFVRANLGSQAIPNPWNDYVVSARCEINWKRNKLFSFAKERLNRQRFAYNPFYRFSFYEQCYALWQQAFQKRTWKPDKSKIKFGHIFI